MKNSKIKMVHLQVLPILSGVQNVMLDIFKGVDRDKYELYVMASGHGPLEAKLNDLGINYISLRYLKRNIGFLDFFAFIEIAYYLLKYRFDIVHTHSSKSGLIGRVAAKVCGIKKIIHTVHGYPFHDFQTKKVRVFYESLEKFAALFCHKIIFVNNSERKYSIEKMRLPSHKCVTIFNGVSNYTGKTYQPSANLKIAYVGRFWEQKNVERMIDGMLEALSHNSRFKFDLFGDGDLLNSCIFKVKQSLFSDNFVFHKWSNQIDEELNNADALILVSLWEGLPLSILEGMAKGLPVVASNIKGNNELVKDGVNGFLVDPLSINSIANGLLKLYEISLQEFSAQSTKIIEENFLIKDFWKKHEVVYGEAYDPDAN